MRLPRWLLIPALIIFSLYWTQEYWQSSSNKVTLFDIPKTLEERAFTLQVYPVSSLNKVLVFSTSPGGNEEDYLYLTPAPGAVDFPADFREKSDSGFVLQVHGKFYKGTGIPEEYFNVKPKPERYRVFQFDAAEMVAEKQSL